MGYAVELFFDKKTESLILEYWESLYENGLSKVLYELRGRPHISLAVYNDIDILALDEKLTNFLKEKKAN